MGGCRRDVACPRACVFPTFVLVLRLFSDRVVYVCSFRVCFMWLLVFFCAFFVFNNFSRFSFSVCLLIPSEGCQTMVVGGRLLVRRREGSSRLVCYG